MTAEARQWRNTLRWSTNNDFFQTFGSTMSFIPKRHQLLPGTGFYPVCSSVIHKNIISKEICRVFVLQCRSTSHRHILSRFIEIIRHMQLYSRTVIYSSYSYTNHIHSFIHTIIHSYINTFTH